MDNLFWISIVVSILAGVVFGIRYYTRREPWTEEALKYAGKLEAVQEDTLKKGRRFKPRKKMALVIESILLAVVIFFVSMFVFTLLLIGACFFMISGIVV